MKRRQCPAYGIEFKKKKTEKIDERDVQAGAPGLNDDVGEKKTFCKRQNKKETM